MRSHQISGEHRKPPFSLLGAFTVVVCIFLISPILVVFLSSLTAVEYVSFYLRSD